jgi:hypothetical protein
MDAGGPILSRGVNNTHPPAKPGLGNIFAPPKHWLSQFYPATTTHTIHKSADCRTLHKCSGKLQGSPRPVVFPNAHAQAPAHIDNSAT